MFNFITESSWLETDFLKQTNQHIRILLSVYSLPIVHQEK